MARSVPFPEAQELPPSHESAAEARDPGGRAPGTRNLPAGAAGAAESVRAGIDGEKQRAASGVEDVAMALREAARRRHEQGDETLGRLAGSAADGLERLSGSLRQQDMGRMLRDADGFARRQPAAFFGLSLAAGFLAVRFLKASRQD